MASEREILEEILELAKAAKGSPLVRIGAIRLVELMIKGLEIEKSPGSEVRKSGKLVIIDKTISVLAPG